MAKKDLSKLKNVLLLHPKLLFYKIPIYNKLSEYLKVRGINLIIWAINIEKQKESIIFDTIENHKLNYRNFNNVIEENNITHVVNILSMSDPGYLFYFKTIFITKLLNKKYIFYGHGMNLEYKNSLLHRSLYNCMYLFFDRIILYTPNEIALFWQINKKKISIAYNTLDLEDRNAIIPKLSITKFKTNYKINHSILVLFSGRIQERKKLNLLIELFAEKEINSKAGLVIVGPGMNTSDLKIINESDNIYYLGPIYDKFEISQIFNASHIFCIPGHMGLGLIEAFFWGLPVLTTTITHHAPEVYYLRNGYNGFLQKNKNELKEKINELIENPNLLNTISSNARKTYLNEASLDRLFSGFYNALV